MVAISRYGIISNLVACQRGLEESRLEDGEAPYQEDSDFDEDYKEEEEEFAVEDESDNY